MGAIVASVFVTIVAIVGLAVALWDERKEKRRKKELAVKKAKEEELLARRMEKQRSVTEAPRYF